MHNDFGGKSMSSNQADSDSDSDQAPFVPPTPDSGTTGGSDDLTLAPSVPGPAGAAPTSGYGGSNQDGLPQEKIGKYTLIDEIARGGMGAVYRAHDETLNRTVALKMILNGRFASNDEVRRFYQEAEAAANLDHAGIIPIYDIGEHEGHHYFAMKLVEGGSLASAMPELLKDTKSAVSLMAKVARAVHFAHQRGILHRDLKPGNILLESQDNPVVTDLGLAKDVRSDSDITHTGAIVGTPAYMPPEQAAGEKEITTAADIYAIGAMLYELLTGRPPHTGGSSFDVIRNVLEKEIVTPRQVNKKVNRTLSLICMKCLQRDANDRYSSAGALADDLENWLEGKPVSARSPSVGSQIGSFLSENLKSAAAAMLIGLGIGLICGIGFGETGADMLEDRRGRAGSVTAIYERLPNESQPAAEVPRLPFQTGILSITLLLTINGLINALVVRPKPGSQALAIGLVSGLMLMIAVFTFGSGFMSVTFGAAYPTFRETEMLAKIALSTPEEKARAERFFFRHHPDLASMSPEDRADAATDLAISGLLLRIPSTVWIGIAAVIPLLLPSVGGTMLGAYLKEKSGNLLVLTFRYLEIAFPVSLISGWMIAIYGGRMMDTVGTHTLVTNPIYPLLLCSCLAVAVFVAIRSWRWPWRILFHFVWIVAFLFMGKAYGESQQSYAKVRQFTKNGQYDEAARWIDDALDYNPNVLGFNYYAAVLHAYRNDHEAYLEACERIRAVHNIEKNWKDSEQVAKACLLLPNDEHLEPALKLAKDAAIDGKNQYQEHWHFIARLFAAHRENDHVSVETWAERCRASFGRKELDNPYYKPQVALIQAMSLAEQGDRQQAATMLKAVKEEVAIATSENNDNDWIGRLICEILLREANNTIDSV